MQTADKKNISTPDETRSFEKGKMELVKVAGHDIGLATFEPGWKWSECVKPIAKTDWCQADHFGYTISGRAHILMSSGEEYDTGPGDVFHVPPGHDAWVVGNEPWVTVDWAGATNYAKRS
jgi:hypothetical protein